MRNKYPGICYRCGETVKPGDGFFESIGKIQREKWPGIGGRWHVQHELCADKHRGTSQHFHFNPIVKAEGRP